MSRPLRVEYPGALYLVTARVMPRQRLFRDDAERRDFLGRLPELAASYGALFHGFCVLPDHYHLLVETPLGNLSRVVHRLNAGYTAALNGRRNRAGPLLHSRYRALLLGEEWLVPLTLHVHLNPVRKKLTPDPWSYLGSSARAFGATPVLVPGLTTDRVLSLAGGRAAYVARLEAAVRARPPAPWKQAWRQLVLGGEDLRRRVLEVTRGRDVREVPGFSPRSPGTSLATVLAVVGERTGLEAGQITGGKYQRVLARKAAIYLARRFTSCTLREIGDTFGVDYTTVHMTVRRVEELRTRDAALGAFLASLEEALGNQGTVRPEGGDAASAAAPEPTPKPAEMPLPRGAAALPGEGREAGPSQPSRARRRKKEGGQLDLF
jgi:REP element-mobilizing transposase RayT